MKKLFIIFISVSIYSCLLSTKKENTTAISKNITTENYELIIPEKQNAFLILFPCFPCNAENTATEFAINNLAIKKGITVLMMNFNQHLWLSENEKKELKNSITQIIKEYKINAKNTFIGGFSSGGNVSLLLTNYLKSSQSSLQPKGVFIVDSPIDLLGLYENAKKNIEKNYSEVAVQEALWIVSSFDAEFGAVGANFSNYQAKSPYIFKTHSIDNLAGLKNVQIRFYSEPDTTWWKENRQADYKDTNAYYIEQLASDLKNKFGENSVEYITSQDKGYRSNGERHPHSWSIVDKEEFLEWILK